MQAHMLTLLYEQIQKTCADEAALTVLSINAAQTQVVTKGETDALLFDLPIGLSNLGRYTFKHYPPTVAEMENAIALVEDEVMPLAKKLPPHSRLFLAGDAVALFDALHPTEQKSTYPLEEVEELFRKLAEVIEGRPAHLSGLPKSAEFATLVLIVREFMHHLRFEEIRLWR